MSTASRSFDIAVARPSMAWWSTVADSTWTKVACGPTAAGVEDWQKGDRVAEAWADPSLSNIGAATDDGGRPNVFAYSGGAVDQGRGEYWVCGGGHRAYPGNEPYVLQIFSDVPGYVAMAFPSPGSYVVQGNSSNGPGQYAEDIGINGAPQSNHTYNRLVFANDRLWLIGQGGQQWDPVYGTSRIFSFSRETRKWSNHGLALTTAQFSQYSLPTEEASAFYYPAGDVILASFKGGQVDGLPHTVAINPHNGAVVAKYAYTYPTSYGMQQSNAKLIDGTSKVIFISENYSLLGQVGGVFLWDAANPTTNPTRLTVTDTTGGLGWLSYACGMVWDPLSEAMLLQRNFGEVFVKLAPNTPGHYSGAWTASKITPANVASSTRVVPPTLGWDARPYSRWNIIHDMGDGRGAIVWQPDTPLQPAFLYAIPASGL